MSTYTENYRFPMYEGTDAPNLLDDYNSFAQLADSTIKQVSDANTNTQTAIGNLTVQVEGFDERITAAQSAADSAASTAGTASGNASSALTQVQQLSSTVSKNTDDLATLTSNMEGKAPNVHTSTSGATYGQATAALFGHTRLTDTPGNNNASSGYAATPALVQSALDAVIVNPITIYAGALPATGWTNTPTFGATPSTLRIFQIPQARLVVVSLDLSAESFNTGETALTEVPGVSIPDALRPTRLLTIPGQTGVSGSQVWSCRIDVSTDGTLAIRMFASGDTVKEFNVQINGIYCYGVGA